MKLAILFILVAMRSVIVMTLFTAVALLVLTLLSVRLSLVERVEARLGSA